MVHYGVEARLIELQAAPELGFSELSKITKKLSWSQSLPHKFNFYYEDVDNDVITMSSEQDFQEAMLTI